VRRLLLLATASPVAYVQQHLTGGEKLSLATSPYRSTQALFDDCLAAAVDDVPLPGAARRPGVHEGRVRQHPRPGLGVVMDSMFETVASSPASSPRPARPTRRSRPPRAWPCWPLSRMPRAAERPGHPGFVSATGLAQLRHVPRYLGGITARIDKLLDNPNPTGCG